MSDLVIRGDKVRCANCGTIYNKPPAERAFGIGVPFRVEGMPNCPQCGSNAANIIEKSVIGTTVWLRPGEK